MYLKAIFDWLVTTLKCSSKVEFYFKHFICALFLRENIVSLFRRKLGWNINAIWKPEATNYSKVSVLLCFIITTTTTIIISHNNNHLQYFCRHSVNTIITCIMLLLLLVIIFIIIFSLVQIIFIFLILYSVFVYCIYVCMATALS